MAATSSPLPVEDIEPASILLEEMMREGVKTIHPHPNELKERIATIAKLGGRKAPWDLIWHNISMRAIRFEVMRTGRRPSVAFLEKLQSLGEFYRLNSPSLGGGGREEVVRMYRGEEAKKQPGILARVFGGGGSTQ